MSLGNLRNICSQSSLEVYHCCEWISPAACLTSFPLECLKITFNRTCCTPNSHTFILTLVLLQFLPHDSFITRLPAAQTDPKELSLTCLFLPHLLHPATSPSCYCSLISLVCAPLSSSSSIPWVKLPSTLTLIYLPQSIFHPAERYFQKWKPKHILPLETCSTIKDKYLVFVPSS